MPVTMAVIGGIGASAQAIMGTWQYLNAVKQAKRNTRPTYSIDPAFQYNIDILKNTQGLPQSALEMFYRNAGQSQTSGINAILANGGNSNNIAGLVNNQQRNFQDVLAQDALQRKQDILGINNAQLQLAGENDKAWQLNQFDPYKDKAQAISAEKGAGIQNLFGAFNSAAGTAANIATAKLAAPTTGAPTTGVDYAALLKQLMPTTNTTPYGPPAPPQPSLQPINPYLGTTPQPTYPGYTPPNFTIPQNPQYQYPPYIYG